jgi:protein-arginine kinase activator protein McsA
VVLEESEPVEEPAPKKKAKKSIDNALSQYSYLELSTMLEEVLANENYERAAEIRDELNKRDKEL